MNKIATHRNDTKIGLQIFFRVENLVLMPIMERIVFCYNTNYFIFHIHIPINDGDQTKPYYLGRLGTIPPMFDDSNSHQD